jgi:hypothetical protein
MVFNGLVAFICITVSVQSTMACPAVPVGQVTACVLGTIVQISMDAVIHICDIDIMTGNSADVVT